jgi:hypothetical protein
MTRKSSTQNAPKLGKSPRDREKELDDERWWDEERESFPQYWYVVNTILLFLLASHALPLCGFTTALCLGSFPSEDFRFQPLALSLDV